MINLSHDECYGCQACLNICPRDAITMREDDYGYRFPRVDLEKCIQCNLCVKVCPELNQYTLNAPRKVYAAVVKDHEILDSAASGGFASILSRYIINDGGVVYGCSENNFEDIGHIRIANCEDLRKIRNSKYVHSDIRHTFRETKKDLDSGLKVLFTGTPCQISGLLSFLRKPYDNLLTMDLICHGVPPMKMLKEQVLSYPEIKGISPENIFVDFRWKEEIRSGCGSICFGLRTAIRSGDELKVIRKENDITNSYMRCFQTGISLRENCLNCPYARKERVSDLTAADFWGLGRYIPSDLFDLNGVSLVLINTNAGENAFNKIQDYFDIQRHSLEEAKLYNRCLSKPFARLNNRERFLEIYKKHGLILAAKKTDSIHKFESSKIIRLARKNRISSLGASAFAKLLRILKIIS